MTEYNIVRFYTVHPDDITRDGKKETSGYGEVVGTPRDQGEHKQQIRPSKAPTTT
jgi:hypothetical protein